MFAQNKIVLLKLKSKNYNINKLIQTKYIIKKNQTKPNYTFISAKKKWVVSK